MLSNHFRLHRVGQKMYKGFGLLLLLNFVVGEDLERDDATRVKPQDLDQLLKEERYEEFAKHLGIEDVSYVRPVQGREVTFRESIAVTAMCRTDLVYTFSNKPGERRYENLWPMSGNEIEIPIAFSSEMPDGMKDTVKNKLYGDYKMQFPFVRIKDYDGDEDYVYVFHGPRCFTDVGRRGGPQAMSILKWCSASVSEKMMHVAGIPHEHNRRERLSHITIHSDEELYHLYDKGAFPALKEYDYFSIMHFSPWDKFNRTGEAFHVMNKCLNSKYVGKFFDPTVFDIQKVKELYGIS